jgi:hypothetical protein
MKPDPSPARPARPLVHLLPAFAVCVLLVASVSIRPAEPSADRLGVGLFSQESPGTAVPTGWEPLTFKDISARTVYTLVDDDGTTVVCAHSRSSASGLIRKMPIDPNRWPVLSWRWRISNVYENGDLSKKAGDDYPARIFVAFRYDPDRAGFFQRLRYRAAKAFYGEYPPASAINYIWANRMLPGTVAPDPHSDRAMMLAVQSGDRAAGRWVSEKRNVLEDYRRLYGEDPPMITGVAIMTDSDNTGEAATAWYGDIVFQRQ